MTAVLAATLAACGSDSSTGTTGQTPTLDLALSASSLSVQQGASGTVTVTITRGGGLTANVDLSIEGAPTGVTATFTPASLASGVTSSSLLIAAGSGAAAGTTSITVRAKSTGVSDKTATIAVTVTAAPANGFTLSASPASGTLVQGTAGVVTINVARTGTFTGPVALTVSGAPTGVTTVLSPTSVTGTTSTLSTSVSATATPGNYNLVVSGTGAGVANQSTTVILVVQAASAGGFSLSASALAGSVVQGASGTSTITVTRTAPFTGAVGLTVTGAPTGMTATLNPTSVTGTTSTLTIATASTTTPGTYVLTIGGTASGVAGQTTTVSVTVAPATAGTGNVTYTFCATNAPIWMAAQDGQGAWTRVTPGTNNDFKFNIASTTGGIAYVTTNSGSFTLNIVYGSQAELIAQGTGFCPGGATKTLTGTVAGMAAGDAGTVTLGGASAGVSANGPYTLNNVPGGLQDLLASDVANTVVGTGIATTVKKIIIRRNQNLANNAVIPTLDFGAAEAITPGTATVTLANGGSDFLSSSAAYFTANGSAGGFATDVSTGATRTYYGIPAAQQVAGDLHLLIANAIVLNGASPTQIRSATLYFKDLANKTLTFGPAPNTPTVTTAATTPVARLRAQWTVQTEYNKSFVLSYSQSISGGTSRTVTITASSAYLGGNPTAVDITMPDLSGVAGWDNNWGLRVGTSTSWFLSSSGWNFTGSTGSPVDAGVILSGTKLGTITP